MKTPETPSNDLAYWFPKLEATGVPIPKTEIIKTECELIRIFDGENPDGFISLCDSINVAAEKFGYPVFIRSGQTSAKHEWNRTCFLNCREEIAQHVGNIVEYGECASLMGLPYDTWVVREMLKTKAFGTAFQGMPIAKERRYFIQSGQVLCHHPYWPEEALRDYPEMMAKLDAMNSQSENEIRELSDMSKRVSLAFEGAWSLDWLETERGWLAIDMAIAADSYHWPNCPRTEPTGCTL